MANIFFDDFTVGSDTALASHTPNTGTSWTLLWQTGSTAKVTVIASTDRAKADATVANSGVIYTADATYPSADYEVSAVIPTAWTGTNKGYLIARLTDVNNMYALRWGTGATNTRMYKKVAGTWTALGSFKADPAAGDTIKIRVEGTTLKWYINGVLQDTQTDSSLSAAGKAGIGLGGGANLAASTDDILNTSTLDDFTVAELASPPTAPSGMTGSQNGAAIDLLWSDNSANEANFILEKQIGTSPNWYQIATPAANAGSYTDTDVHPGYTYRYRVAAKNTDGTSAYSTSSDITMSGTKAWRAKVQAWIFPGQADAQTELIDGRILWGAKPEYGTVNTSGVYSEPTGYSNMIDDPNINMRSRVYSKDPYFTVSAGATGMMALVADSTKSTNAINGMVATLTSSKFAGVELDWEGYGDWTLTGYNNYKTFVAALVTAVHAIGKKVIIIAPPIGDTTEQSYYEFKYEDFESSAVDYILPMCYDWDFDFGGGTAIAPIARVQNVCKWIRGKITDVNRIIVGVPSYGYYATTGAYDIVNITEEVAKLRTGYSGRTALSGANESIFASGGLSTVFVEQAGMNAHREMIENEGIKAISVWHLGDNPWYSGKTEPTTLNTFVTPGAASLTITMGTPTVSTAASKSVTPGAASLTITMGTPTVTVTNNKSVTPGAISLTITRPAPTITISANKYPDPGAISLVITPAAPTINLTGNKRVTPGAVALTITPAAPAINTTADKMVNPGAAAIVITMSNPLVTVTNNKRVTPGAISLTLTPGTPAVRQIQRYTPGHVVLNITPAAPTINLTGNIRLQPGAASLTLTPAAAVVTASDNKKVYPGGIALTITPSAPTITRTQSKFIHPGTRNLVITTFAPKIRMTGNKRLQPGGRSLTITMGKPGITFTDDKFATPAFELLEITMGTPTVTVTRNKRADPNAAALHITMGKPTISLTKNKAVRPGAISLAITTAAPALRENHRVHPGHVVLNITPAAPTLHMTGNKAVRPGAVNLHLTLGAPTIRFDYTHRVCQIWNGSEWVTAEVRVWNGTEWLYASSQIYTPTGWVAL